MSQQVVQILINAVNQTGGAFQGVSNSITGIIGQAKGLGTAFTSSGNVAVSSLKAQENALATLKGELKSYAAVKDSGGIFGSLKEQQGLEKSKKALDAYQKSQRDFTKEQALNYFRGIPFASTFNTEEEALAALKGELAVTTEAGVSGFSAMNLGAIALVGGIGVAVTAFQNLGGAVKSSFDVADQRINQIITATKTLGLSQADAAKYVDEFNIKAAKLGATLPIDARNISELAQALDPKVGQILKGTGITPAQEQTVTLDLYKRLALTAKSAGVSQPDAVAAIQGYLSGSTGVNSLGGTYAFFGKSDLALNLQNEYKKIGGTSVKDVGNVKGLQLLAQALQTSVTDSSLELLNKSPSAKISNFSDTLFDPQIGALSFNRKFVDSLGKYTSVEESFETTLELLLGNSGLFTQFTRLAGGKGDVLEGFKSAVDGFNNYLQQFVNAITNLKASDSGKIGYDIGKFAAQATNLVFDGILSAIGAIDYGAAFKGIGGAIIGFFVNLDWKVYLGAALAVVGGVIATTLVPGIIAGVTAIGAAILAFVGGVPLAIGAAIVLGLIGIAKLIGVAWTRVSTAVVGTISAIGSTLVRGFNYIINFISGIFDNAISYLQDLWASVTGSKSTVNTAVTGSVTPSNYDGSPVKSSGNSFLNFISGGLSAIGSALSSADGSLDPISQELLRKPNGSSLVIANSSESILRPDQLSALAYGGNSQNVSSSTFNGGISVSLNLPGGTALEIANQAINIIEQTLKGELNSRLA